MIDLNLINKTIWPQKQISILGAGKSGLAASRLATYLGANVFISESSQHPKYLNELREFNYEIGGHTDKNLESDLIIISPGVSDKISIIEKCKRRKIPIVGEIEFASWFTNSPILALTGSNGKTTTINLLHEICISDGKNSLLGGNIGIPFSENVLWELKSKINNPIHILELSSFQLEYINSFSPAIAGILNISEDHMDRYESISEYVKSKLNIAKNLSNSGWFIYNADDPILSDLCLKENRTKLFSLKNRIDCHYKLNASKIYSGDNYKQKVLFKLGDTKLRGLHNIQNILAASTMAYAFGISESAITNAIINFTPIPHRLEWVGTINNVDFFNDSKATNIAAAQAAIQSFTSNLILILGGQKKGETDFTQLNPSIQKSVKSIIAYGQAGKEILKQLKNKPRYYFYEQFEEAVLNAHANSSPGDTVLLSPGCASFDQFNNYEHRGETFKKIYKHLELFS